MTITGSVGAMDFFELIQGTRFPLTSYSITAACVVVDEGKGSRRELGQEPSKPCMGGSCSCPSLRPRQGWMILGFGPHVFGMTFSTETPDAILDVVNGSLGTIPALGLQGFRYGFGTHRKWKLKDTPVTCGDDILLASPRQF